MTTLGVVIRFRNSARTLPRVLECLSMQTRKPDLVIGVDNRSEDESKQLLLRHGASVVSWNGPYHVTKVLNSGIEACKTDLVVVLSSHSALVDPDTLERYEAALHDPRVAAASHRHRGLSRYSDVIDWEEVLRVGMSRGSFYSNSAGCLRRSAWEEVPFDERNTLGSEDYDWALAQLALGNTVRLLDFDYEYLRSPERLFRRRSRIIRAIANAHGLRIARLGPGGDLYDTLHAVYWYTKSVGRSGLARRNLVNQIDWIRGALDWRRHDPFR